MDELDHNILKMMEREGYQSSLTLASLLKTNPRTVQRHVRNMADKGIFRVIAIPNFVSFGFKGWARIGLKVDPLYLNSVARELLKSHFVYFLTYSLGHYDIIISVALPNWEMLTYFINYELSNIQGITSKETMLFVHPVKYYRYIWPVPEFHIYDDTPGFKPVPVSSPIKVSEIDRKILQVWLDNGLIRPAAIKDKLQIPESAVRKSMNYMRENNMITLEAVPNSVLSEYEAWATIGINTKYRFNNSALNSLTSNLDVYLVSFCMGKFDLVIAVRFQSTGKLLQFISEKLAFIEGILSIETFLHGKPLKYHNIMTGREFSSQQSFDIR